MKLIIILMCLLCVSAQAANYVGERRYSPLTSNDHENIRGDVILESPGTYAAAGWSITGGVRLIRPGTYTLIATADSVHIGGSIDGPFVDRAVLNVTYRSDFLHFGFPANTVSLVPNRVPLTVSPDGPPVVDTISPPRPGAAAAAPLINISTRATLGPGGVLTPGFVVGTSIGRRVLIRAIGPGLAALGVTNPMLNPTLRVFRGQDQVASNDDWGGKPDMAALFAAAGAFPLPADSKDAAVLIGLNPGNYTVEVRGVSASDAGEIVVEVYYID